MIASTAPFRKYSGPNPFSEAQARSFGDQKTLSEFYPTSLFWSFFNEQHEILVGSRGSGKTILLKMMSFSRLRHLDDPKASHIISKKSFIGLYVPLHLEFTASIPGNKVPDHQRREYFQFCCNCAAAEALITEVTALIEDSTNNGRDRLLTEAKISKDLSQMWFPKERAFTSLDDVRWSILLLYQQEPFWQDGEQPAKSPLAGSLLSPIKSVLQTVARHLGLSSDETNWLICFDEAEFLCDPFMECINSVLRSEKRPLVIKMATLPFKHRTRKTTVAGVSVEPNGNDFNYRSVDLRWDQQDFEDLTNHICRVRWQKFEVTVPTVEDFLGKIGNDDWVDYFRYEMKKEATEELILEGILSSLSRTRRVRYEGDIEKKTISRKEYFNRFSPVYYVRRLKQVASRGNRAVGWFAGAPVVRRVADGNPRRFIQLMHEFVHAAAVADLTPKNQHRAITAFCHRAYQAAEGLPDYGPLVHSIITSVGTLLAERVHGISMYDGGCRFRVGASLLDNDLLIGALRLAVAYSHILIDEGEIDDIKPDTDLRLSFIYGVEFWLPMRKGELWTLKSMNELPCAAAKPSNPNAIVTPSEAHVITQGLQLSLFGENNAKL